MIGAPSYGEVNHALVASFLTREEDRALWALNLMRYRAKAVYPDGRKTDLSGIEADNLYAPFEQLEAVGARVVLVATVERTLRGDGVEWHRVALVRYPTHRSLIEMSMREDFQERHVHKEAGMERTIVLDCHPTAAPPDRSFPPLSDTTRLLLHAVADEREPSIAPSDAPTVTFESEGAIIGDGRPWSAARLSMIEA